MGKCSNCHKEIPPLMDLILNGVNYCSACLTLLVQCDNARPFLTAINILRDDPYTYKLTKAFLIRLLHLNLTKQQYRIFKEQYPHSSFINSRYYSESGDRLQPIYYGHQLRKDKLRCTTNAHTLNCRLKAFHSTKARLLPPKDKPFANFRSR